MRSYLVVVAARDEPGALAWVTRNLAKWDVNLKGLVVDAAGMQLLVSDITRLRQALDDMGFIYRVSEVHEILLTDRPGALADVCTALYDEGINVNTAFGISGGQSARLFLSTSDMTRAAPILAAHSEGPAVLHGRLGRIGPAAR